jgi:hypothetical protein
VTLPSLVSPGNLPHGRHRVTEIEVYERFVTHPEFVASSTRPEIWAQYEDARELLKGAIRVHAVWVGGSFTTSKLDPQDIDAVFLVSARDYARASKEDKQVVDAFAPRRNAFGVAVRGHPFNRVDSFVLHWRPWPNPDPNASAEAAQYCQARGYWDDFWQRLRKGSKDAPPTWHDGLPERGYLEVELDAFDR